MKIENTFNVAAPPDTVWRFINTPEEVAACVPGCEAVEQIDEGRYRARVKTKVGPIKTEFSVDINVIRQIAPEFAEYETNGTEGGKASRLKATSSLRLRSADGETTEISYSSEVTIVGRLGKFGAGMMQKVADKIGAATVENMRERLEGGGAQKLEG